MVSHDVSSRREPSQARWKRLMAGRIQLKDSYVSVKDGEVWLLNAHIYPIRTATSRITSRSTVSSAHRARSRNSKRTMQKG